MTTVQIIITNWDEKGESVGEFGRQQPGYESSEIDAQPHRTVLKFKFDSNAAAQSADKKIATFAEGLGYHIG